MAVRNPLRCSKTSWAGSLARILRHLQISKEAANVGVEGRLTSLGGSARVLGTSNPFPERPWASSLTHAPSALFVSLSDLQRTPFSLPRTVAPQQGPPFPQPRGLRPLRFCITAQLPCTRLSLRGPPVPSGSLAACSLLLQVAFIGLSLGFGVLSCFLGNCGPRKPEQLLAARAGSCWPSLLHSLETEDTISWFMKRQPAVLLEGNQHPLPPPPGD